MHIICLIAAMIGLACGIVGLINPFVFKDGKTREIYNQKEIVVGSFGLFIFSMLFYLILLPAEKEATKTESQKQLSMLKKG